MEWVSASVRFEEAVKSRIAWEGIPARDKDAIQQKLTLKLPPQQVFLNSLYITLVAAFEEYLRQLLVWLADDLTKRKHPWAGVGEQLRRLNVRESARLLARMDSPPEYLSIDIWDMCKKLGTLHSESTSIAFNSLAIADIPALIKLENFILRAGEFGVVISFDSLGANAQLRTELGVAKTRDCGNAIRNGLGEICRRRNRIAHTGLNASDITEELLKSDLRLLRILTTEIDVAVRSVVQRPQQSVKAHRQRES